MMHPRVTLIAAVAENRVIGRAGGLPWRLPDDLKRFKALTMGHAILMGRRTFEELNRRPLPGRRNIIVSRTMDAVPEGVELVHSLEAGIRLAESTPGPIYIGGGGVLYEAALPLARTMELTEVQASVEGDAYFPQWEPSQWELANQTSHPADAKHLHAFRFSTYHRIG